MDTSYLTLPNGNGEDFLINESNIEAVVPYTENGRPMAKIITVAGNEYIIDMTCEEFQRYRVGDVTYASGNTPRR